MLGLPWKRHHPDGGSMCFSITCWYLSVFMVHFQMCKLPDPKPLMHLSVRDAGFRTEHWWLNKPDSPVLSSVEDTASMFSKNNVTFWWIWPQKSFYLGLSPFQTCSVPKKTADDVQLCPFPPYSLNVLMIIWVVKILCCVHYSEIVSDWRPTFLHVLACWRVSVSSK